MKQSPRNRLGQHFLSDHNLVQYWVSQIQPRAQDHFVEIGPGEGALTQALLPHVVDLAAIELDASLVPRLKERCEGLGRLNVYTADAVQFDYSLFVQQYGRFRVVGNLPYQITSPLLFQLLKFRDWIIDMHFLLQKEVVQRLAATPGSTNYSRLTVMIQYYCEVEGLREVPPQVFKPPPRVMSQFVRLKPYASPLYPAKDERAFAELVKLAFNQRRKQLHNCLKTLLTESDIRAVGIDPQARPQMLRVEDFVRLSNVLNSSVG